MFPIIVKPSPYKDNATAYYYGWEAIHKESFLAAVTDSLKDAVHHRSLDEALKKCEVLRRDCPDQNFEVSK